MITVYSEKHRLHDAKTELYGGTLVPPLRRLLFSEQRRHCRAVVPGSRGATRRRPRH